MVNHRFFKNITLVIIFVICYLSSVFSLFAEEPKEQSQERRNPFIALVTEDGRLLKFERTTSGPIQIEGIIYDPNGSSYAIVNKEVVRVGDWVGQYQVYKIQENKVIFLKETEEVTFELTPPSNK